MPTTNTGILKGVIIILIAAVILGIVQWVFEIIDFRFLTGYEIEVVSTSRGSKKEFYGGEKLRFGLKDIESTNVIWVFEESDVIRGDIEIEHTFPFLISSPKDLTKNRRIDAFFKFGNKYKAATKLITTINRQFSSTVGTEGEQITLFAQPTFDDKWALMSASVGRYKDGFFVKEATFPRIRKDGSEAVIFGMDRVSAMRALGVNEIGKGASDLWVSYGYVNSLEIPTDTNLTIVIPLDWPEWK